MAKRLLKRLASCVIAQLDHEYKLVYVDARDRITEEQTTALVAGDHDKLFELLEEFESESRWTSTDEIIKRGVTDVIEEWSREDDESYDDLADELHGTDAYQRIEQAVWDRDKGSWVRELVRNSGDVLMRVNVVDEDHGYSFEEVAPERVLTDVGLPVTDANVAIMRETLAECSPEFSVLMGYWILGVDLEQLYDLPSDCAEVTITNPYLYLGNPFIGSGWISERPFEGVVTVKRADLRTDKDAFGYSVSEVYGGLVATDFACDIAAVTVEPAIVQEVTP